MNESNHSELLKSMNLRIVFGRLIATDKRIANLSDDAQILFLRAICNADMSDRIVGDQQMLLSLINPRAIDRYVEDMDEIVREWIGVGLVEIVPAADANSDPYLRFTTEFSSDYVDPFNS